MIDGLSSSRGFLWACFPADGQVHLSWVRGETPMGSVRLERFWLRLKALNERLAAWEPILGDAVWNLDFLRLGTREWHLSCPLKTVGH